MSFAGIAQLVEQRIRNAWVVGSNPIPGSLFVVLRSSAGSNSGFGGSFNNSMIKPAI